MWARGLSVTVIAVLLAACGSAQTRARPNLLLVTIDTLRADHCSGYGYHHPTTPELDALASDGVRFAAAYAPTPVTGPSHASLLTSLDPQEHGVLENGVALAPEATTLAEVLREAGYDTAAVVSGYPLKAAFGFAQGFQSYEDNFPAADSSLPQPRWDGRPLGEAYDRRAGPTTDRALDWLSDHRRTRHPFFLWIHYFDPHTPYDAPAGGGGEAALAPYDAEIRYTDAQVGRVLALLDGAGLRGSTLVAVTSDHGEGLGDHGQPEHGAVVYEEAVRVPLLLRWPGELPGGLAWPDPATLLDLAPTLAGLMEVAGRPPTFRGLDLSAGLRAGGPPSPRTQTVFLRSERRDCNHFAARRGRWKYLETRCQGELRGIELFDLEADPRERHDLSGHTPAAGQELAPVLQRWRRARGGMRPPPATANVEALRALGYR